MSDSTHVSTFRQNYSIPSNVKLIGCIARYNEAKGHLYLLQALNILSNRNIDYRCFLIGRGVEQAPELQQYIKNIREKLIFLGERSDASSLYGNFDLVVIPSLTEGFPNVLLEAIINRVPVICTDVGDCRSIISPFGCVVKPKDSTSLADSILNFFNTSESIIKEKTTQLFNKVIFNYSIDKVMYSYRSFCNSHNEEGGE